MKTDDEIRAIIAEMVRKNPRGYFNVIRNSHPYIMKRVMEFTSFLDREPHPTDNFVKRLWYFYWGKMSREHCAGGCGMKICRAIKADKFFERDLYCHICVQKKQETLEKKRDTNISRGHSPNWNNREKAVDTCARKYGVSNTFNIPEKIEEKRKRNVELHGDPNWNNSEKAKSTVESKVEADPEYWHKRNAKIRESKVKNGHSETWNNTELRMKTCMAKYGVSSSVQLPHVRENAVKRIHELKTNGFYADVVSKKSAYAQKIKAFNEKILCDPDVIPLFSAEDYATETDRFRVWKWKCRTCGMEFENIKNNNWHELNGSYARCPKCHPVIGGTSNGEKEFIAFLASCDSGFAKSRSVIPPYEIDAVLERMKLCFEYDGLYYHSALAGKPDNYHLMKTGMCASAGYTLVHVFEDEWLFKQDIVKSRVRNMLGFYDKTVFARKCEIRDVGSDEARKFLDENHLQGAVNSSVRIGLYFENQLISLMTFGKCRFDKRHEWEMLRFCNRLNCHVPGAASKLLKYFEKNWKPKSLVSYADRRWSNGNLYNKLGFTFTHSSKPDYWYFKNQTRFSRIQFQKHKLKNKLQTFDPEKTEKQNMFENKFNLIYDCGNLVFEKEYN